MPPSWRSCRARGRSALCTRHPPPAFRCTHIVCRCWQGTFPLGSKGTRERRKASPQQPRSTGECPCAGTSMNGLVSSFGWQLLSFFTWYCGCRKIHRLKTFSSCQLSSIQCLCQWVSLRRRTLDYSIGEGQVSVWNSMGGGGGGLSRHNNGSIVHRIVDQ